MEVRSSVAIRQQQADPIVSFMRVVIVPDQISRWIPGTYLSLGTDGFGMSDTREALRRHFEVDGESIALGALTALERDGQVDAKVVADAIAALDYDSDKFRPTSL